MRKINGIEIDDFTHAYIVAALWSTNDESTPQGGEPMDKNYHPEDIDPDTLRKMADDCAKFRAHKERGRTVDDWRENILPKDRRTTEDAADGPDTLDGHDFWLTRNGHGAGFWDRGYGIIGQVLTDAAHRFGEVYLYVGDDGKIHQYLCRVSPTVPLVLSGNG